MIEVPEDLTIFQEIEIAVCMAAKYPETIDRISNNFNPGFTFEFRASPLAIRDKEKFKGELEQMDFMYLNVVDENVDGYRFMDKNVCAIVKKANVYYDAESKTYRSID